MAGAGEVAYSANRNWRWGYEEDKFFFSYTISNLSNCGFEN